MLGTYIGVLVNDILPETIVFIFLFVTLVFLTYKALMKGIDTYKSEKAAAENKSAEGILDLKRLGTAINPKQFYDLRKLCSWFRIYLSSVLTFNLAGNEDLYQAKMSDFREPLLPGGSDSHANTHSFDDMNKLSSRESFKRNNSRQSFA
jgi:hypothetical protein